MIKSAYFRNLHDTWSNQLISEIYMIRGQISLFQKFTWYIVKSGYFRNLHGTQSNQWKAELHLTHVFLVSVMRLTDNTVKSAYFRNLHGTQSNQLIQKFTWHIVKSGYFRNLAHLSITTCRASPCTVVFFVWLLMACVFEDNKLVNDHPWVAQLYFFSHVTVNGLCSRIASLKTIVCRLHMCEYCLLNFLRHPPLLWLKI